MRVGCGAVLAAVVCTVSAANADVYRYRSRSGALVFTNAPVVTAARVNLQELPPARPMFEPVVRRVEPVNPFVGLDRAIPVPMPTSYDGLIREIADRYSIDYALVKAVIKAESDFDRTAVSSKGAQGLMQLMPATALQHQVRDAFLPRDNIEGG
jgi:hypothetical protein